MKLLGIISVLSLSLVVTKGQNGTDCPLDIGTSTACYLRETGCYCLVNRSFEFDVAYDYCRSYDMELVSIESSREQEIIVELISSSPALFWWTSGSDAGHEGQWLWLGTGQDFNYTNWHGGSLNGAGYDVMQLSRGLDYQWIDAAAHPYFRDPSICEMP